MEFVNSSPNPIHACVCAAVSVWLCGYVAVTLQHMTLQLTSTAYWFGTIQWPHAAHCIGRMAPDHSSNAEPPASSNDN